MEDKSLLNFKSNADANSGEASSEPVSVSSSEKLTKQSGLRGWYAIHTNTGYEDQVADNLRQRVESFGMQDKIFNVIVPKEKEIEIKNGKRRTVEKKIFPGYVLVEMIVTDESWYVVRNTPSVTGFIGMGIQPTPMSPQEMERIMKRMGVEEPKYKIELVVNDLVRIKDGPLKGFEGKITDVDSDKGRIKVLVSMFGRETPVTLDFLQVSKV
jgi:transcriptional antiterminator NusG